MILYTFGHGASTLLEIWVREQKDTWASDAYDRIYVEIL